MTTEATTSPQAVRVGVAERWFPLGVAACTVAVAGFLLARLTAWPPHEDETLALFVGRESLPDLFQTVQGERGGAPLHFLFAWLVVHMGGGLEALRMFSALFAVASVPVIAALGARVAGRAAALVATALVSASWMLLFHGVYGRMYSLFLFTSTLSYLALLRAVERGGRREWALWGGAMLVDDRGASVRGARARVAGSVCTRARAYAGGDRRAVRGLRARHALLVQRPRPRGPVRGRRRRRRQEARRAARRFRLSRARRR